MGFATIAAMLVVFAFFPGQGLAQSAPPPVAGEFPPATRSTPSISEKDILALPAQELRDKPVFDTNHERVATVKDVTGTPGSPRQAILQTGGVLGIGGTEVKLPLEKLEVGPDGELMLTMTESQLKLLPRAN